MANLTPVLFPALGQLGDVVVSQRTALIEIGSDKPISARREIITVTDGGTVTTANGRRVLTTSATGTSKVILESAKRGRYKPGSAGEAGVAVFVDTLPVGNQSIRWGYFDDNDGFCFGIDAAGMFIERRSGGVIDAAIRRDTWNGDKLDVETDTDWPLNLADGNIFQIPFTWYGSGPIIFQAQISDKQNRQRAIVFHRMRIKGNVSVQNPNLPIRVEIDNGGTASSLTAYVTGRKFEVVGAYNPNERLTSARRFAVNTVPTTPTPIFSVRRKAGMLGIPVELSDVEIITTGNCIVEAYLNATLTGLSAWGAPPGIDPAETALEYAIPTGISGGQRILDKSFGTTSANAKTTPGTDIGRSEEIPADQVLTLVAYALTGSVDFPLIKMRLREDW